MPFPFHVRVFPFPYLHVLTQASVGILHSLNQHFWGNISLLTGTGRCFLERNLTPLLSILSATSSALALLNASLILPSLPHRLVRATSVATNGPFTLLLPSPPSVHAPGKAGDTGPFPRDQQGLSGVQHSSKPSLAAGLRQSPQVLLTHTGAPSCPLPPLCLWVPCDCSLLAPGASRDMGSPCTAIERTLLCPHML